jgi:hypothetical protein
MIKPREEGDFEGWHRTPIERVAYLLNLLLGLDYVPPTVYRQKLEVGGRRYHHGGAVIFFVEGLKLLEHVSEADWGTDKSVLLSDTRVLVCLSASKSVAFSGCGSLHVRLLCSALTPRTVILLHGRFIP